jgi:glucose/arabinose dehydrogenase
MHDKVYAVIERSGKREVIMIASGLDRPSGLAFKDGILYVAEGTKISKLEGIGDRLDNPPRPVAIYSDFPDHRSHGWKPMRDGSLLVSDDYAGAVYRISYGGSRTAFQ